MKQKISNGRVDGSGVDPTAKLGPSRGRRAAATIVAVNDPAAFGGTANGGGPDVSHEPENRLDPVFLASRRATGHEGPFRSTFTSTMDHTGATAPCGRMARGHNRKSAQASHYYVKTRQDGGHVLYELFYKNPFVDDDLGFN